MSMTPATNRLTLQGQLIDLHGHADPASCKTFEWFYPETGTETAGQLMTLLDRIREVYPDVAGPCQVCFVNDMDEKVNLPADDIKGTVNALKPFRELPEGQEMPVRIFIQPCEISTKAPGYADVVHICSDCFCKLPEGGHVFHCSECPQVCGICGSSDGSLPHVNLYLDDKKHSPEFSEEVRRQVKSQGVKPPKKVREQGIKKTSIEKQKRFSIPSKPVMPEVKLVFKCGVLTPDGLVDPNGFKFLTWSYVTDHHHNGEGLSAGFSHETLAQRVQSVYPEVQEPSRIVYIDEEKDRVAIPCESIKETLAALKVMTKGHPNEETPIRIFIQPLPPAVLARMNTKIHSHLTCSGCKKGPIIGFLYHCLQCEGYNLCGKCNASGIHPQHLLLRISDEPPSCLSEMKQLVSRPSQVSVVNVQPPVGAEPERSVKVTTCTLRVF